MHKLRAAYIQTEPAFGDIEGNVERAVEEIGFAAGEGASIAVLPELFSTGYQFRTKKEAFKYSEDAREGRAALMLVEAAKKGNIHIVAGINERHSGSAYNSSILVGPCGVIGIYRKTHLFWDEKKYFTPGNTGFEVYDIDGVRLGMMICFDWFFPEAARTLALKGADIICHPSNLVLPYCPEAMKTRCLENRVYAITANRVGAEERLEGRALKFIGLSQVASPKGEVLKRASAVKAETGVVEVDIELARNKKITPHNDIFKDRRTALYGL